LFGVNLPRWGLKRKNNEVQGCYLRVNLPRWGLKQGLAVEKKIMSKCKFTPLGFETKDKNVVSKR